MRNYALSSAEMNGTLAAAPADLFRHWLARRRLARLSPAALTARGLTEADRTWALSLPLDCNPDASLSDRIGARQRLTQMRFRPLR